MPDTIQGTDAWRMERLGKATASRIADIIAKTKTGWGASRKNYLAELVAERLTGVPAEGYQNAAMIWGTQTEPQARAAYQFFKDLEVVEVGFVPHPLIKMAGASPDGYVGADGLIEIKCPNTATHIETILTKEIAGKYITQMQFQLACTDRQWCDFVSFDPRMPEHLKLFVKRVRRDPKYITELETAVSDFLADVAKTAEALGGELKGLMI